MKTFTVLLLLIMTNRYFNDIGWRLIDFGVSMSVGSAFSVCHDSTQFRCGGRTLRAAENGSTIEWGFQDDFEMLIAFIFRLLKKTK
jgi:hypothetical protein